MPSLLTTLFFTLLVIVVWAASIVGTPIYIWKLMKRRSAWVRAFASALGFVIALPVITWFAITLCGTYMVIQVYVVQGGSMLPTYRSYDFVLVNALDRDFSRTDIVVFRSPESHHKIQIARIIGLPNEDLMVQDGDIKIDGKTLDEEPYWSDESVTHGDIQLSLRDGDYFLMGDNRGTATDSRDFGAIKHQEIIGTVFYTLPR